jgi:hypothetical protein
MHNAFLLSFWSVVAFKETVNVTEPKQVRQSAIALIDKTTKQLLMTQKSVD